MRTIDEIANELFNHPDFVVGNLLTRKHIAEMGYDPDNIGDMDWAADPISDVMWDCVTTQVEAN